MDRKGRKRKAATPANNDTVFQVDKIIRKRQVKKKLEYLVKWQGYSDEFNSWEPAVNFLSSVILKEFEEAQASARKSGIKEKMRRRSKRIGKAPKRSYSQIEEDGLEDALILADEQDAEATTRTKNTTKKTLISKDKASSSDSAAASSTAAANGGDNENSRLDSSTELFDEAQLSQSKLQCSSSQQKNENGGTADTTAETQNSKKSVKTGGSSHAGSKSTTAGKAAVTKTMDSTTNSVKSKRDKRKEVAEGSTTSATNSDDQEEMECGEGENQDTEDSDSPQQSDDEEESESDASSSSSASASSFNSDPCSTAAGVAAFANAGDEIKPIRKKSSRGRGEKAPSSPSRVPVSSSTTAAAANQSGNSSVGIGELTLDILPLTPSSSTTSLSSLTTSTTTTTKSNINRKKKSGGKPNKKLPATNKTLTGGLKTKKLKAESSKPTTPKSSNLKINDSKSFSIDTDSSVSVHTKEHADKLDQTSATIKEKNKDTPSMVTKDTNLTKNTSNQPLETKPSKKPAGIEECPAIQPKKKPEIGPDAPSTTDTAELSKPSDPKAKKQMPAGTENDDKGTPSKEKIKTEEAEVEDDDDGNLSSSEPIPEPPSLLPQVSESEAWIIKEKKRIEKEQQERLSAAMNNHNNNNDENGAAGAGADQAASKRTYLTMMNDLGVLVTDVAAHSFNVIFKESSTPNGFFHTLPPSSVVPVPVIKHRKPRSSVVPHPTSLIINHSYNNNNNSNFNQQILLSNDAHSKTSPAATTPAAPPSPSSPLDNNNTPAMKTNGSTTLLGQKKLKQETKPDAMMMIPVTVEK